MARKLAVGIDLGGTKVAAAVYDGSGARIGGLEKLSAAADEPAEMTRDNLFETVRRAMASADVAIEDLVGIGIGAPGPLDPRAGLILHTPNLPHLRRYALVDVVAKEFETNVVLSNDGNCFALAESTFGAGRGHSRGQRRLPPHPLR